MTGWLIISSEQNFDITASLAFKQQGLKSRHRKKASEIAPGDLFFYYITGIQRLAGMLEVRSFVEESDDKVWVNLGKDPNELYPWRFETRPLIILEKQKWPPMASFAARLLHFRKWPAKHWRLGLQGQVHALRKEDVQTLRNALESAEQT